MGNVYKRWVTHFTKYFGSNRYRILFNKKFRIPYVITICIQDARNVKKIFHDILLKNTHFCIFVAYELWCPFLVTSHGHVKWRHNRRKMEEGIILYTIRKMLMLIRYHNTNSVWKWSRRKIIDVLCCHVTMTSSHRNVKNCRGLHFQTLLLLWLWISIKRSYQSI